MKANIIPEEVNLLLIEDNDGVAQIIAKQLNSSHHTKFKITRSATLQEALQTLDEACALEENCDIDVILLDLVLPNSHGVDTFLQIKKNTLNIPIVIISAHEDIACKCIGLGAQDYLVKPDISASLLIRSVKYSIQRSNIEKKMRNVIMTSSLGYHMYEFKDDDLYFTGYNPAADKILNVDNSKFLGKKIRDAFPNISDETYQGYIDAVNGTPWANKVTCYKDDNIAFAHFKVNAYKTSEGCLTITFEDISNQIKTEKKLQTTLTEYKNLIEVTRAGVCGIDFKTNKFTYVNNVICNQLGYTREELIELSPKDILTKQSLQTWLKRRVALKKGEFIKDTVEYQVIRKDGSLMWVLVTADYVEDANKNIIGVNVVAIDITEKKIAEEIIKQRELEAYSVLEGKLRSWKEEITKQDISDKRILI